MPTAQPIVGAYYRSSKGPIVQVEKVDGPRWLARFVFSPIEENRANHRQWMPWWPAEMMTQVPPQANVGEGCRCGGCEGGRALGIWPSIVPLSTEPPGDAEGRYCDNCPGPQPGLDCECCDESEGAKEDRRAAVRARGGN